MSEAADVWGLFSSGASHVASAWLPPSIMWHLLMAAAPVFQPPLLRDWMSSAQVIAVQPDDI